MVHPIRKRAFEKFYCFSPWTLESPAVFFQGKYFARVLFLLRYSTKLSIVIRWRKVNFKVAGHFLSEKGGGTFCIYFAFFSIRTNGIKLIFSPHAEVRKRKKGHKFQAKRLYLSRKYLRCKIEKVAGHLVWKWAFFKSFAIFSSEP